MITNQEINKVLTKYDESIKVKVTYQWINNHWEEYEEELDFVGETTFDTLFSEEN